MRSSPAAATISPALPPLQPSRLAIRSRTGRVAAGVEQLVELRGVIPVRRRLAGVALSCPRQPDGPLRPIERAGVARERRAEADLDAGADGRSAGFTLTTVVVPSRSGRSTIRLSRVMTLREPPEARTAPATTRRPLPRAPRWGRRRSLVETIGRAMLNRRGDLFGRAVDPGAARPRRSSRRLRQFADARPPHPLSSPLSASSFITSRVSLSLATPAFCCSPSTVRNSDQSSRSNFKSGAAGKLAKAALGFSKLGARMDVSPLSTFGA